MSAAADEGCCASGGAPTDCSYNPWPQSGAMGVGDEVFITAQLQHTSASLFETFFFSPKFQGGEESNCSVARGAKAFLKGCRMQIQTKQKASLSLFPLTWLGKSSLCKGSG